MTVGQIVTEGLLVHEPSAVAQASATSARSRRLREVGLDPDAAQPLPARILRRPAPAHRHRPRHDPEAEGGRAGRADLGARPLGAEADRRTAARAAGRRTTCPTSSSATISPVVRAMADYIIVMKQGKIVEEGPTEAIFSNPQRRLHADADGCGDRRDAVPAERLNSAKNRDLKRVAFVRFDATRFKLRRDFSEGHRTQPGIPF